MGNRGRAKGPTSITPDAGGFHSDVRRCASALYLSVVGETGAASCAARSAEAPLEEGSCEVLILVVDISGGGGRRGGGRVREGVEYACRRLKDLKVPGLRGIL